MKTLNIFNFLVIITFVDKYVVVKVKNKILNQIVASYFQIGFYKNYFQTEIKIL